MRSDLKGVRRRKILLSESKGFHATENGMRKKKSIRGNTVSLDVVQINMKVTKHSSRSIDDLLKKEEEKAEEGDGGEQKKEEQ